MFLLDVIGAIVVVIALLIVAVLIYISNCYTDIYLCCLVHHNYLLHPWYINDISISLMKYELAKECHDDVIYLS